jgi:hypothetical protein
MPTVKRLVAKAASNRVVSVSFRIPCIASVSLLGTTRGAWIVKTTSTSKSISSDRFAWQIN